jgi:hypothetical protein
MGGMIMEKDEKLWRDYEETLKQFQMLADIRFKLLAFVPTITGVAITVLTEHPSAHVSLAIGFIGFFSTIGIMMYELRNSQFYNAITHRAKCLEDELKLPISTQGKTVGGMFNERPGRELKLLGLFTVWHDRGLALVYGSAVGGWVYLFSSTLLTWLSNRGLVLPVFSSSVLLALLISGIVIWEFRRLEKKDTPQLMDVQGRWPKSGAEKVENTIPQ